MTASRRLLYGEASRMHYSGVILAHSSTVSSNLEGSMGLFYELWSLVLIFNWIQVRWLAALFSFSETNWVSLAVFGIIVLLKCPPLFHLHHPGTVGVGTEPANINFHWLGAGLLSVLIDYSWCLGFPCLFAPPFLHVFNTFSLCHSILLHIT